MNHQHRAPALRGTAVPRSIVGSVRADGANAAELIQGLNTTVNGFKTDFQNQFDKLQAVVTEFRASNDAALKSKADVILTEKVDRLNGAIDSAKDIAAKTKAEMETVTKEIDKLNSKLAGLSVNGVGGGRSDNKDPRTKHADYPAYAKLFNTYFRKGDKAMQGGELALRELEIKASMSIGSDPDGGYTVLPEIEQTIDEVVKQVSPMRDICTVRQIGTNSYKKLVNLHGTNSGWSGEVAARPNTLTPSLSELIFPVMELYAQPAATQSLLDDAYIDIGQWLAGEVQLEFAQKEAAAFVSGDGVLKPSGFLGAYPIVANASYAWGKLGYISSGGSSGAYAVSGPADCLVDLYHSINTVYRSTSVFLANRGTLGTTRKLKDGQGNYLLNMVFRPEGFIEEILGRPAIEVPDMPDMATNAYAIAFGDFKRGYLIVDRIGIRVLRDPYTSKPYVLFYTTKRVGGGISNFEAIKLLKFS